MALHYGRSRALMAIAQNFFQPIGAAASDRFGRRHMMTWGRLGWVAFFGFHRFRDRGIPGYVSGLRMRLLAEIFCVRLSFHFVCVATVCVCLSLASLGTALWALLRIYCNAAATHSCCRTVLCTHVRSSHAVGNRLRWLLVIFRCSSFGPVWRASSALSADPRP